MAEIGGSVQSGRPASAGATATVSAGHRQRGELVHLDGRPLQLRQGAELRRDGAHEPVVAEIQLLQAREPSELRRDAPGELVVIEVEILQLRELTELRRDAPRQAVPVEEE